MSAVADTLRAARALIDTPEKWGQGWFRTHADILAAFDRAIALAEG